MPKQIRRVLIKALTDCGHEPSEANDLVLAHEDRSRREFVQRLNVELAKRHMYFHSAGSPKLVEMGELNKVISTLLEESR